MAGIPAGGFVEGADALAWLPRGQDSNLQGEEEQTQHPRLPAQAKSQALATRAI